VQAHLVSPVLCSLPNEASFGFKVNDKKCRGWKQDETLCFVFIVQLLK